MNTLIDFLTLETIILVLGMSIFFGVLLKWHLNKNSTLDLSSIVVNNGVFSLSKLGQLIALLVSTWIIVYQTRHNLLTEWLFTGYMFAWGGANLVNKWIDGKKPDDQSQNKIV